MTYKRLPVDKKVIEEMKKSTPDLYHDMVNRFGEENVINNLLVDYCILTEDRNIVTAKDNMTIQVNKDLINRVMDASNNAFEVYLKEPINKLKSWIKEGDATLGYTPIMLDHNQVSTRQGYILGGSYKAVNLDNKLHLLCKAVLIAPEAKFNYLNGLYREVSPTITGNGKISEVSIVNVPAQITNTSLSAGDDILKDKIVTSSVADEWTDKIIKAKLSAEEAIQQSKITQKENLAKNLTEQLLVKGVISSSKRAKITNMFIQLSSGEEQLVANALLDIGKSPLNYKSRSVFLKGSLDMNKTKDDRFLEFTKAHRHEYASDSDCHAAFDKLEATSQISLSAGEGAISDPMGDVMASLEAMKKGGQLTDEHKKMLGAYCGHSSEASLEDGIGDGKNTKSGGIDIPNNTSLSAPNMDALSSQIEILTKGFEAMKQEAEQNKLRAEAAESSLASIKSTLGV